MRELLARLDSQHGPGFGDHGSRVATFSVAIGENLGLGASPLKLLWLAALIHDVGKTRVDPAILDKRSKLAPDELSEVRKHPEYGHQSIGDAVHVDVAEAVLCHHEQWDGSGYPSGVKKNDIPLFARIILVADAFDVMIGWRSYRERLTVSGAGEELTRSAGRQFDPRVVDAFAFVDTDILNGKIGISPA